MRVGPFLLCRSQRGEFEGPYDLFLLYRDFRRVLFQIPWPEWWPWPRARPRPRRFSMEELMAMRVPCVDRDGHRLAIPIADAYDYGEQGRLVLDPAGGSRG